MSSLLTPTNLHVLCHYVPVGLLPGNSSRPVSANQTAPLFSLPTCAVFPLFTLHLFFSHCPSRWTVDLKQFKSSTLFLSLLCDIIIFCLPSFLSFPSHTSTFLAFPPPALTADHNVFYVNYALTSTVYLNFMQCCSYLFLGNLVYLKTNFSIHYLRTKMRWKVCSISKELVIKLERQEHISVTFAVSLQWCQSTF